MLIPSKSILLSLVAIISLPSSQQAYCNDLPADNSVQSWYQQAYHQEKIVSDKAIPIAEIKAITENINTANNKQALKSLELAPFHYRATAEKSQPIAAQGFCGNCHSLQPHYKSAKTRSFLNMHVKYIACHNCHLVDKQQQLSYQWQTNNGELKAKVNFADKGEHRLIALYQGLPLTGDKKSSFAKEIMKLWQTSEQQQNTRQQALIWQNIHQVLNDKASQCHSCHQQKNPRFKLTELGADKQRQHSFEQNIIARFFSRYRDKDDKINLLELLN